MRNVGIIMRRELASYFATPLAYVFILIFLVLANAFTFYLGGFFERGQADLEVSERDARLTALPKAGATILPALSELAARQGFRLKELHLESGRLDEVFRTITA